MIRDNCPRVLERMKAVAADSLAILIAAGFATWIFEWIGEVSNNVRMWTLIFLVFLYDPVFTSFFGGTLGQLMNGMRVKREKDTTKNIILPLAMFRFLVKYLFGWLSMITVTFSKKGQAIHDLLVFSVVIYAPQKNATTEEISAENQDAIMQ